MLQWVHAPRLGIVYQLGSTGNAPEYSLPLDGLVDERAQGITIDVGWRFFRTPQRHFILVDAPGHEQYTRNMATAASQSGLALILVDARKDISSQECQHAVIVKLFDLPHVVVAVTRWTCQVDRP